jgi:hypothetical protein
MRFMEGHIQLQTVGNEVNTHCICCCPCHVFAEIDCPYRYALINK